MSILGRSDCSELMTRVRMVSAVKERVQMLIVHGKHSSHVGHQRLLHLRWVHSVHVSDPVVALPGARRVSQRRRPEWKGDIPRGQHQDLVSHRGGVRVVHLAETQVAAPTVEVLRWVRRQSKPDQPLPDGLQVHASRARRAGNRQSIPC